MGKRLRLKLGERCVCSLLIATFLFSSSTFSNDPPSRFRARCWRLVDILIGSALTLGAGAVALNVVPGSGDSTDGPGGDNLRGDAPPPLADENRPLFHSNQTVVGFRLLPVNGETPRIDLFDRPGQRELAQMFNDRAYAEENARPAPNYAHRLHRGNKIRVEFDGIVFQLEPTPAVAPNDSRPPPPRQVRVYVSLAASEVRLLGGKREDTVLTQTIPLAKIERGDEIELIWKPRPRTILIYRSEIVAPVTLRYERGRITVSRGQVEIEVQVRNILRGTTTTHRDEGLMTALPADRVSEEDPFVQIRKPLYQ